MRSPVIAFSIFAAAAVSPSLVGAAPTSPNIPATSHVSGVNAPVDAPIHPPSIPREMSRHSRKHDRRGAPGGDAASAGGNAYSGAAGDVSGGNSINDAEDNEDEIMNTDSSNVF